MPEIKIILGMSGGKKMQKPMDGMMEDGGEDYGQMSDISEEDLSSASEKVSGMFPEDFKPMGGKLDVSGPAGEKGFVLVHGSFGKDGKFAVEHCAVLPSAGKPEQEDESGDEEKPGLKEKLSGGEYK